MLVFCDTSAFYAVGNRYDEAHGTASRVWRCLLADDRCRLITTNYVFLETFALAQRRRGLQTARSLAEALDDSVEVAFVDDSLHRTALKDCLDRGKRNLSLVDCVSFAFMRRLHIQTAFAFDRHFFDREFESATKFLRA